MSAASTIAVRSAVSAVTSQVCLCGRRKFPAAGFCGQCWRLLPVELQRRMYPATGGLDAIAFAEGVRVLEFRANKRKAWKAALGKEGNGS